MQKNEWPSLPGKCLLLIWILCMPDLLHAGRTDALLYYNLIHKAELAICDTDMNAARTFYQQAFAVNKQKPFSKDLMNAFHCAMDTRHYTEAEQYLAALLARGLHTSILNTCIYPYYKGDQLQKIHSFLQRHRNDTLKKGETAVMIARLVNEAKARRNLHGNEDTAHQAGEQYARQLCRIFCVKGIPSEAQTGNYINLAGSFIPSFEPLISRYSSTYHTGKGLPALDSMLYQAIFTFDYDPQLFAINHERRAASYYEQYQDTKPFTYSGTVLHWPFTPTVYADDRSYNTGIKYPAAVIVRMNRERETIGLETIEALYRKFIFLYTPTNKAYRKYQLAGSAIINISKITDHDTGDQ